MTTFQVDGMTCGSCIVRIRRAIAQVDDEALVAVDVQAGVARILSAASDAELVRAIQDAGYAARTMPVA